MLSEKLNSGGSLGGYQIQRSLRFNSADSAYLNRTYSTGGTSRKILTFSAWMKLSTVSSAYVFYGYNGTTESFISLTTDGKFRFSNSAGNSNDTTAVFRDFSAWYHVVFVYDSTQAQSSQSQPDSRVRFYVNGVQQATSGGTMPSQNADHYFIDANNQNRIGAYFSNLFPFAGYMTEVNVIDGQALTPSSFGEYNADTGVWQPKAYSGTYGTNGFYLNFSDNSNTTATTLGKDYSGNGNNWTPNNFSVSAGAGNDSLVDVPTNWGTDTGVGGTVRGNYCTLNPLSNIGGTYSQGNLRYVGPSSWRRSNATISRSDGKWYWEVTLGNAPLAAPRNSGSAWNAFGFGLATAFNSTIDPVNVTDAVVLADNAYYKNFSGAWTDYGTAFQVNDVLSIAVDLDANTFTLSRNNTQVATGTIGGTAGRELVPIIISYDGTYGVMDCNFGQRPFAYTAPSGFKALCTQNLSAGTITTSGTFIGNGSADGPFVYLNGVPTAMTINGNAVTFATHADKLSNGFKVRTSSSSYNNSGASNSYSITTTGDKFKYALAQPNP